MPTPMDPRKKPAEVKIQVSTGAGMDIVWADGHRTHYAFDYLRNLCPCATCDDERRKKEGRAEEPAIAADSLLPMFKAKPRARSAHSVGNYAIQIDFTDGHSTGIYSYDYLRSICPCAECANAFRAAAH